MKTIYRLSHQHIGQVRIEEASEHLNRLNAQGLQKWKVDFSDFLYCEDELDEDVNNPIELSDGYCFIVTAGKD